MARRRFIVALIAVFCATPALAQKWIMEEDGDVIRASITTKDLRVTFSCARSGPRPGFAKIMIEALDVPQTAERKAAEKGGWRDEPVTFQIGEKTVVARMLPFPRRIRAETTPEFWHPDAIDRKKSAEALAAPGVDLFFGHSAEPERAVTLASIVAMMTQARSGMLRLSAPAIELTLSVPLAGAAQALKNMDRGCIDFLPEPEDEEQGPWHQGISETERGPLIMLMTQSGPGVRRVAQPLRLNLAVVCDAGELSVKLLSTREPITQPIRAGPTWWVHSTTEYRFTFTPNDLANEASLSRDDAIKLAQGLLSGWALFSATQGIEHESGRLVSEPKVKEFGQAEIAFDAYGFAMASRHMRKTCAIPGPAKE